jgi:hypothetical protein
MMRHSATALLVPALMMASLSISPAAHATTVLKVGVADMTSMAEWVVRGRVIAIDQVVAEGDKGPFTDVRIAVDESYRMPKGAHPKAELVIRLMGGKMADGLAMKVPGMPRFVVGDEAVFFLERTGTGLIPCGLEQGVWRLVKGPFGYEVVQQTVFDANLVVRTPEGKLVPDAHGPHRVAKLLSALVAEIRATR